ncbi:transcriptional repressor [Kineosporia rhizophila]|uniref:Fur family transcriptional regulator n=1 Tax=Kineosporia TaxID=49184 RepID=UPI000AF2A96B|nr:MULTISPECIES: transcriptional repressor [Kineosporia]MCE0539170.1 transcriptional repressor [Kineosporia rhizophila]GLY18066.1 transcriptional repressor [Kineosporia sp. NBRC 101677]
MSTNRRETKQRVAVSAALDEVNEFVSAQQLHTILREGGDGVGLATVYRTLQQLAEDGEVDVLKSTDNESMYRRCSRGHHHHLLCRSCRRTVEVESPSIEKWAQKVAAANGFADVDHVVEITGICAECQAAARA